MLLGNSAVLFSLPADGHACVANVGLFSVLDGSRCDVQEVYSAYHRSSKVLWGDALPV